MNTNNLESQALAILESLVAISFEQCTPITREFKKMFLVALPEHIQKALLAHAAETEYPIEMVLEMAIAGFLDSEC